ncbi:hypothetical protein YC2023_115444 [Brassica napus]
MEYGMIQRCSKRQRGLDASVEPLKSGKKRKLLKAHQDEEQTQHRTKHHEEDRTHHPENTGEELEEEEQPEKDLRKDKEKPPEAAEDTQKSKPKTRRGKRPTRLSRVAKNPEDKIDVEFNTLCEHIGDGSVLLSSFLGIHVREHVPVLLEDWRQLDELTKDTMWEEIQVLFSVRTSN